MPDQRSLAAYHLPTWGEAAQERGRQHTAALAELAAQRPRQWAGGQSVRPITSVGICGAGIMGAGIAVASVQHGLETKIYDASSDAISRASASIRAQCAPAADLLSVCEQLEGLTSCDLVIESVVENRELKQRILKQLAKGLAPHGLLVTNTSTVRISQLATSLPDPGRFCGLHFCNPVAHRRLVEIVRGPQTSSATIARVVSYVVQIDKLPIVVHDGPGFLVNRLLLPYLNEALEMICQGAKLSQIDQAARRFGMEIGPLQLFDLIGIDTAMWAGRTLWEAFPDRTALTPVLPALVKRGRLGQKTGRGFYHYPTVQSTGEPDEQLSPILAPYLRRTQQFTNEEITLRLFLPMLVEATRAMEDRVVNEVRDIDIGTLFGLAFPPQRGGLLFWADSLGADMIVGLLRHLRNLGERMFPTELLQTLAQTGGRFYDERSHWSEQPRQAQSGSA